MTGKQKNGKEGAGVVLDWDGIPDLKKGLNQPEEDTGKTALDLLNAQA